MSDNLAQSRNHDILSVMKLNKARDFLKAASKCPSPGSSKLSVTVSSCPSIYHEMG
jgi:hypothetical protein